MHTCKSDDQWMDSSVKLSLAQMLSVLMIRNDDDYDDYDDVDKSRCCE